MNRAAIVGLLAAGLPIASAIGQGQSVPTAAVGYVTISGIALDSVRGGPLIGATLIVEGFFRHAISDSNGRFHIDSVEPGERRIGIFHPILDSLGIGISSPLLTLRAGDAVSVVLATPSPRTIAARFCQNATPPSDGQTRPMLLTGRLLDSDTEEPVAGARVEVSWLHMEMSSAGLHRIEVRRAFITGPSGAFHFCQLPTGLKILIGATRDATGAVDGDDFANIVSRQYDTGSELVGIVVLHLPSVGAMAAASGGTPHGTVSGRVTQKGGAPAISARVSVVGSPDSTLTDANGRFVLRGLPSGTHMLVVRAIGYEPTRTAVEISEHDTRRVDVTLGETVVVLDSIRIVAELQAGYVRVGFDRRRLTGVGFYMTATDVARKQPETFHDILIAVPGIRVAYGRNGLPVITPTQGSGNCVGYVIDGVPYLEQAAGDIDDFIRPEEVGAIEVYGATEAPGEYRSAIRSVKGNGGFGCAVVVIWTKSHLGL